MTNQHTETMTLDKNKLDHSADPMVAEVVLSRNPNKAMQEMMDTITALRTVYEEENHVLAKASTSDFLALQEKKIKVARNYQRSASQMIERKGEFEDADPELKQKLFEMHEDFTTLATENLKGLDRMRKGVDRLNDRIMGAARDAAKKDTPNYKASGDLNMNERAVSIGVNESA